MTSRTPIEPAHMPRLLAPLTRLPNAPELDAQEFATWTAVMQRNGVTVEEFQRAVLDELETLEFYPPPSRILNRVKANRETAFKASEQARLDDQLREGQRQRAIAAAGDAADKYDLPPGYPPRQGPPIDPTPIKDPSRRGPVLRSDGTPDPFWPEIPGRAPAWRRRLLYDAGLASWESASALTADAARRAPSALRDATTDTTRGGGPRRIL